MSHLSPMIAAGSAPISPTKGVEAFAELAEAVAAGEPLTSEAAAYLVSMAGPLARELVQRRRIMETVQDLCSADSRIFIAPGSSDVPR